MREYKKSEIWEIANAHGFHIEPDWNSIGSVWPLLEKMMDLGSVVLVKLDGKRTSRRYTILAMGGPLGDENIRGDFLTLEDGLCYLIGNYFSIAAPD